jgi:hypothetical protein
MLPHVFPLTVMSVPSVSWHVMGMVVGGTVVGIVVWYVVGGVDVVVALATKAAITNVHNSSNPLNRNIFDFIFGSII